MVREGAEAIIAQGGKSFGWFDFDDYQGNGKYQKVANDPDLLAAMLYVASLHII
jgi:hypothetical protein